MIPEPAEIDPVIDIDSFMERVGQDLPLAKELADLFVMEAPRLLAAIMKASAEKDGDALSRAAHALKGSAANFSASKAVRAAAALERMGANPASPVWNRPAGIYAGR